ncbi:MAG: polysaccharide biosynthesis C-terminal domain-containing protein, partial [Patescibacteria group bacterium]
LLNACDKQKINTINMGITLAVSIILNLILIPKLQTIGASITVVATNILMFILGMFWVPTIIKFRPKKIIYPFLKSLLAGIIMGVLIYLLKEKLYFAWVIILGAVAYFLSLFLIGGFRKEDVASIFNSFIKKSR